MTGHLERLFSVAADQKKKVLILRFKAPFTWSHDCILRAWQLVCIYGHLQCPWLCDCKFHFLPANRHLLSVPSKKHPLWTMNSLNNHGVHLMIDLFNNHGNLLNDCCKKCYKVGLVVWWPAWWPAWLITVIMDWIIVVNQGLPVFRIVSFRMNH